MTDIQFEEEPQYQHSALPDKKPFFIRLVLATGVISTDKAAEYVLLGFAVVCLCIALFIFMNSGPPKPPPADQIMWNARSDATPRR
ncbi:hypothetical protein CO131_02090 [Candidatus Kaiserbacteria bacterium CG_4_9_14_3_um_filter_50_16]|uniref:Uncharacterized protein n=2 Tax=Candidatus Kaiseribacteriota TaxID=1752734 RepID=A0A2M7FBH7_9BACT|nr:MAG: hypothetical protein AUJ45_00715 [Parcubacteria group bacterium CG1_02_50_68]PIS43177.1 MAG: hypothetical protein COT23_02715 [Candidatus Kaiserbacteria bacterium CG08_land_8_20_14_0_20_50_21]PIU81721.1 MAG: hypothetical protein COS69_02545 [Candidatus Kaiserbacteria bacterium CG06_land_8_20_14_3_00_49_31]PIV86700.1 MAG: hypothetical protein COW49_03955 [Candidatus Kaiserbacteria bacterium CG17_big_fil_post_rev_8_21_14_2_50_51_7]PIW96227.1 MAG: hypothetical protein COZ83_01940 [Candidat